MEGDCEGIVDRSLEGQGSSRASEIREGIVDGSLVQKSSLTSSQRQASRHSTTNQIIVTKLMSRSSRRISRLCRRFGNYDPWKVILLYPFLKMTLRICDLISYLKLSLYCAGGVKEFR